MEKNPLICLIMATMLEAKPFIDGLSLTRGDEKPFPVHRSNDYVLIISGIGKANAAMASAYSCLKFSPSCLINLGAAGATGTAHPLGTVLHIKHAVDYDRPDLKSKVPHEHVPEILEGFSLATVATLDRPVLDVSERQKLSKIAELVDMESASFIQTCKRFRTKCYLFKFVSDTPAHTKDKDIVENIKKYRNSFFGFFLQSAMQHL